MTLKLSYYNSLKRIGESGVTQVPSQHARLLVLSQEIDLLKEKLRPTATGHIHTAINVLEYQIKEIEETINYETE